VRTRVKLFAIARELAGTDHVELELPEKANVGQLRAALVEAVPPLAPVVKQAMFAIDGEYAADEHRLAPDAEVACIPPVSGG